MSICLIIVGLIQFIAIMVFNGDDTLHDTSFTYKTINIKELDEYVKTEKKMTRKLQITAVIVGILNLFPFFANFI